MPGQVGLGWRLFATDNASPAFLRVAGAMDKTAVAGDRAAGAVERSSSRMRTALASTAGMAAKLGVAFGAYELVKKAIDIGKEATQFQRSMLLIQTQAGASAAEIRKMTPAILALAGPVATAPEKLANSMYHAYSVTHSYAKSLGIVKIAAEGAKVGNADLEETTNALTSAVASGIPGVKSFSQAMGALNTIVGAGDMNLSQLNEALGTGILTKAKTYGLSLTDVGAALATFGDLNIRGADAATTLRMAFEAMAKPAAGGAAVLAKWGLSTTQLRHDMQQGGLNKAVLDLNSHLKAVGITGSAVGGALLDAFGKKGAGGVTLLLSNLPRFETKLIDVAKGASGFGAAWKATTETAAFAFDRIKASIEAFGIAAATKALPAVTSIAQWLGTTLPGDVSVLSGVLSPIVHLIGDGLAGAWKVVGGILQTVGGALSGVIHFMQQNQGLVTAVTSAVLGMWAAYKGYLIVRAAATALDLFAGKLSMMASRAAGAMAGFSGISTASFAMGTALVGVGIAVAGLTMAWQQHDREVEKAKALTADYLGVLQQTKGAIDAQITAMLTQKLATEGVYDAAGKYGISQDTVTKAAQGNAVAIAEVTKKTNGNWYAISHVTAKIAEQSGAIATSTRQYQEMTTQAERHTKAITDKVRIDELETSIIDRKTGVVRANGAAVRDATAAVKANSLVTTLTSDRAKQYATMMGFVVDNHGKVAASAGAVNRAIATVGKAYDNATAAGSEFLASVDAFSKSGGTAADRAALIGAELKAANGDALGFAAAMNAGATASKTLNTDVTSAAKAVGKNGESTKAYLKSIVNLRTGTIDYSKAAAAPLITDLQGIQTAGMNAAQAMFQHAKATMSGKAAADAAYKVYVSQTRRSLIDQLEKLGATAGQAKKLADRYLGMPKQVKTQIEAAGTDPIVTVLEKIGQLLANFTGQPWNIPISVTDYASAKIAMIKGELANLTGLGATQTVAKATQIAGVRSAGGPAPEGWFSVGEGGPGARPELVHKQGSRVDIYSNAHSKAIIATTGLKAPGFASGTSSTRAADLQSVVSGIAGLLAAGHSSHSTASDIRSAVNALTAAAKKLHAAVSGGLIEKYAAARDTVAARLGSAPTASTAYDRLANAKQAYSSSYTSNRDATTAFDVTTAGQQYTDRPATAGSILVALQAQASKAARFAALLKKLIKERMPATLVQQLAAAGPAAYDQALALSKATPAQILGFQRGYGALGAAGKTAGLAVADAYYKTGVASAQGIVNGLLSQQKTLNAAIYKLADGMTAALKKRLGIHSPSTVMRWHGAMAGEGFRLGVEDKFAGIEQAGSKIGNAVLPSGSSGGGGRTVHITQNISTDDPVAAANAALRRIQAHMVG